MNELDTMLSVKKRLTIIPEKERTKEYNNICKSVHSYIFSNCRHEFETDMFDIDPEKSVIVTYCMLCEYIKP